MKEFVEKFSKMIDYAFLGIYKRQKLSEDYVETKFIPALTKACGLGVFLNFKYKLFKNGERILPETEYEMFQMFELPLAELIDKLPSKYKSAVMEMTNYYSIEPLFESIEDGKSIITEEGYSMLSVSKLSASKDEKNQIVEYNGQLIYEELCKGDYIKNRYFLQCVENTYIPENSLMWSKEQNIFKKIYPELFNMCYEKNMRTKLYRCKRCGMILREYKKGIFSCVSKKCNAQLDKKIEIEMHGLGWIMNDIVAHNIYYPGQLEQKIKQVLDKGVQKNLVQKYELWPGKYEDIYDTWDFKVWMNDGRVFLIDAKDVEHPHWIIADNRAYLDGAEFIYVVPNDRTKIYIQQINNHVNCVGKARCIRLREFKKLIEVEK